MGVLRLTAPLAPLCAAVASVLAYLLLSLPIESSPAVPQVPVGALAIGIAATGLLWVLVLMLGIPMTSAPSAQPRLYQELTHRYKNVRDRLGQLSAGPSQPSVEARNSLLFTNRALLGEENGPALRWALGFGYVNVLRAIHRVEQEILVLEPREDLLMDVGRDELSLSRSTIDNRDVLLTSLARVKTELSEQGPSAPSSTGRRPAKVQPSETDARVKAVTARRALDQFRDDARDGIVRSRNQLLNLTFVLSSLTFGLFALSEMVGAPTIFLMSVAGLYLVGVGAACIGRLRIGTRHTSVSEDFGLHPARLLATLLMAGLIAVGGVFLVAALPSLLPAQAGGNPIPALSAIFDLRSNTAALLYAAIFGVASETLTNLLFRGADRLQGDLLASRPANAER